MSPKQQVEIVTELLDSLRDVMVDRIKSGFVPEEWDGVEIRAWLRLKAAYECGGAVERLLVGKRYKAFRNEFIVRNL